ncbi:PREDICTED: uncharacterized protein LOC109363643 [Lupinus angustifolius]|uniref:uncharacterized protein LOC109363643 n=1 Tax=Lupinus angustifolius TaxID=3871 RepID=UPI00092FB274|nr:PREDICTED: uncharacterized protein LOC109363643 [Lupinus angustifolius]
MYVLAQNLKILKKELRSWNKTVFGNIHHNVTLAKNNVEAIQNCIRDSGPSQDLYQQDELTQSELLKAMAIEEIFWKENARINWHIHGDKNTAYFHKIAKIKHVTKVMTMLKSGEELLTDHDAITSHVLDYYTNLFASPNLVSSNNLIHEVIHSLLTEADNLMISSIPSDMEIKGAVFDINEDSAPSPDGYGGSFYIFFGISSVWMSGAERIEDYRPIALANFQFKIITKVSSSRLSVVAPKIVSSSQKGFIKGRSIKDCICIAYEAVNMLDHKTFRGNIAIKLDIKKDSDTLELTFLMQTGVRQGDPLSPILFCLAEEVLNRGISKLVMENKFSTITGPNNLHSPSHVLFADDILIFCKGTKRNLSCLKKIVMDYAMASGQQVNVNKSRFYNSITNHRRITSISSTLGFVQGNLPFNYLVDKCVRNFIWSGDIGVKKLVTVACHKCCSQLDEGGLGIKSIKCLNKAALLKLTWDLKTSNLEWTNFFRLKFNCKSYNTPKYSKSSICPGIRENWLQANLNSIWLVGDGLSVNFWRDNWLGEPLVDTLNIPMSIHANIQGSIANFSLNSNTIIPGELNRKFSSVSHDLACYKRHGGHDKLVRMPSIDDFMTSKDSSAFVHKVGKKLSWKMPTDDNLQKRGCMLASRCNLCKSNAETDYHLFFQCSVAKMIWNWFTTSISIKINTSSIHSIIKECAAIQGSQLREVSLAYVVHIINTIWYCRNQNRFEDRLITTRQAISKIKRETSFSGSYASAAVASGGFLEFQTLRFNCSPHYNPAPAIIEVRWLPPPQGWIKVNSDGVAHGHPGHAGGGGIFRDSNRDIWGCFAAYFHIHDSLFAELHAAIMAIQIASLKGWREVWLECDSSLVVEIVKGIKDPPWKLSNYWEHCKMIISSMKLTVSHIFREGNACADILTSFGVNSRTTTWWNSVPPFLANEFHRNRYLLPNYRFKHM